MKPISRSSAPLLPHQYCSFFNYLIIWDVEVVVQVKMVRQVVAKAMAAAAAAAVTE